MANKRFHFGANSVTKLVESGWNILSFVYQGKCKAGFNTVFERTTWGNGEDANEMVNICVREIIDQCYRTGHITNPVSMACISIKEGKAPYFSTFGLFGSYKKGHLTSIPKDVAIELVNRVEADENLKRVVTSKILNYNEIKGSVVMNELSLSEYLDQRRAE
jgi:hypothetical protein